MEIVSEKLDFFENWWLLVCSYVVFGDNVLVVDVYWCVVEFFGNNFGVLLVYVEVMIFVNGNKVL